MTLPDLPTFRIRAKEGNLVPLVHRMMSDQLTPVLAYRRLVSPDDRTAPSFLLESVEGSGNVGRYSFLGSQPAIEVIAYGHEVTVIDNLRGTSTTSHEDDPLSVPARIPASWQPAGPTPVSGPGRPPAFTGGWVGYAGYDTARYAEPDKLPFTAAPPDDRNLPDMHLGLYRTVAVFDHVDKVLYAVCHVLIDEHATADAAWTKGRSELDDFVGRLMTHTAPLPTGAIDLDLAALPSAPLASNFERADFESAVDRCKAYIAAGDASRVAQAGDDGTSHRMKDVEAIDEIDLDATYTARELIDLLRARTFPPYPGAFFLDQNGARVYLRLQLMTEHELAGDGEGTEL